MNVLTVVDGAALEILCETYIRWRDAEDKIRKHGTVFPIRNDDGSVRYLQQSPFVGQANQAAKLLQSLLREFGMSPSARASLQVDVNGIEEPNVMKFLRNA
jgi:P27 family predicted phage terminase small subunit